MRRLFASLLAGCLTASAAFGTFYYNYKMKSEKAAKVQQVEVKDKEANESIAQAVIKQEKKEFGTLKLKYNPQELMTAIKNYKDRGKLGTAYYLLLNNVEDYVNNKEVYEILQAVRESLEEKIKNNYGEEKIKTVVAVDQFTNYTNYPGLENLVKEYLINYFLERNLAKVRESSNGDIVFKGSIIGLNINEERHTSAKTFSYVAGTHKERYANPEYNTAVAEMERVCSMSYSAKQRRPDEIRDTIDNVVRDLAAIERGSKTNDDFTSGLGFIKLLGDIGTSIEKGEEVSKLERECNEAKSRVARLSPYKEETIVDKGIGSINVVYVKKTGDLKVTLRVVIPETGDILISKTFEAFDEYSDEGWDGYEAAGINANPLFLPSNNEIVNNLFNKIFSEIKDPITIFVQDYQRFKLLRNANKDYVSGRQASAIENCGLWAALSKKLVSECFKKRE
ncbi:MAG: LPS assembly lipoprotein LptE [Candidatus Pacearchaeota archaeon]